MKTIYRALTKGKFYTAINIAGLSVGITACLFIFLYVRDELRYDQFHKKSEDIYRVALTLQFEDLNVFLPMASPPVAAAMQREIPEIEETVRLYGIDLNMAFKVGDRSFTEKKVLFADSNFFQFFSFNLLTGSKKQALLHPQSVVLTPSLAKKYFDTDDVIGKLILIDGETYTVSGVVEEPPSYSHLKFDALISMQSNSASLSQVWMFNRFFTYVRLTPSASLNSVEEKLDNMVVAHIGPDLENSLGVTLQQFIDQGNKIGYDLHAMTDTHLITRFPRDISPASDIMYVYVLEAIGIMLLAVACINFMNLSTAKSASRMREASVRRVLGSSRITLILQMLGESFSVTTFSFFVAILAVSLLLPQFNVLSGKNISLHELSTFPFVMAVISMFLLTGFLAGTYPAFYLTSARVTDSLRGRDGAGKRNQTLRSVLVVFQNFVTVGLIVFTLVLYQQLSFVFDKDLGMKKDGVVILRNTHRLNNPEPLKSALLAESGITSASFTDRMIFEKMSADAVRDPHGERSHILNFYCGDQDQLEVMNLKLIEGRNFYHNSPADSNAVIVNEAAVREFGWETIENQEMAADGDYRYKVVGVVKDFNYETLRAEVKPLMIVFVPTGNTLNIRFSGVSPDQVVQKIKANWEKYGDGEPFEYSFLDSDFDSLYRAEQRVGRLFVVFTVLALFIACLGLTGVASYTAEQRAREIGIRKSLGATITGIAAMLSLKFVRLILLAIVLSLLPVYLMVNKWLTGFAYRIELGYLPFLIAAIAVVVVSLLAVSYQAIRAALINPVNVLRAE